VRALSRFAQPPQANVEWIVGDLFDAEAVRAVVDGTGIVFHAGGQLDGSAEAVERSLVEGTANVLHAARTQRVVHVSSLVVLDTGSPDSPALIDENSPLEPTPERRGVYTRAKAAAEALARAAAPNRDVVIVRPGLVVGSAADGIPLAVGVRLGHLVVLIGPGATSLPVVHAEDLAEGLVSVAERLDRGGVVHLIDSLGVSRARLLRRLTAQRRHVTLPAGRIALATAGLLTGRRGRVPDVCYRLLSAGTPHRWSTTRAAAFGWQPRALESWLASAEA
jgi:nucleoside-diphosphate-sugar epimerase